MRKQTKEVERRRLDDMRLPTNQRQLHKTFASWLRAIPKT